MTRNIVFRFMCEPDLRAARVNQLLDLKSAGQTADHIGHPSSDGESPMSSTQQIDAATQRRLEQSLERRAAGAVERRERRVEALLASAVLAAAVAFAALGHAARPVSPVLVAVFVLAYAGLSRVEFVFGEMRTMPTQLLFVPMLLLLPTPLVPALVIAASLLSKAYDVARGRRAAWTLCHAVNDSGFALAPAVVLCALGAQLPALGSWPAWPVAFAAQFACDLALAAGRVWLAVGVRPRELAAEAVKVYEVDSLLSPIGLLAALAAADAPAAALLVLPLVVLLTVFAREREAHIAQTLEMSRSYRGTALLLRDLLEEDDEYTGHHTEDVVEISVRVAEQLGVSEDVRRETELGALLHDIGKIHIPDAIINKKGPLDDEEWAIMKTHTVEGQRMLDQVGGLLSSVGLVVRASHERYDGRGYPDGLAGADIPLAARIVAVCDSFNAMTTTRSYRKAMPVSEAVAEVRRCAGTQFDPAVADALLAVVGDPGWELTIREPAPAKPAVAPVTVSA
jgi:putative nucleotidyltransferase with HDIG domain